MAMPRAALAQPPRWPPCHAQARILHHIRHLTLRVRVQAYTGRCKEWRARYLLLRGYTHLLSLHKLALPTDADAVALRAIARDTGKSILERFTAQCTRGIVLYKLGRLEEASRTDRKAYDLAGQATAEQRRELIPVMEPELDEPKWVPMGELMDPQVEIIRHNLCLPASERTGDGVTGVVVPHRTIWPYRDVTAADALINAQRPRNAECAQCRTAGVKLSCCRTCKIAYYCSEACQRANWKAHKPQCRAPEQHEEGDVVRLQSIQARPELNGHFVRVVRPDADKPGRWVVENEGLWGLTLSVRASAMHHVLTH